MASERKKFHTLSAIALAAGSGQTGSVQHLVFNDIGYVRHDRDEMEVLFTLLAERYERKSVAIAATLVFSE